MPKNNFRPGSIRSQGIADKIEHRREVAASKLRQQLAPVRFSRFHAHDHAAPAQYDALAKQRLWRRPNQLD
jgi:hypothetical protein